MPAIKVLYIITKLELGGAQKQILSLISALDKNKFTPYLFTAASGILVPDARKIKGLNVHFSYLLERPLNPVKDLLAFFEIRRFIKKNKIDIVHTHSSKAGIAGRLAAKAAGVRVIMHTVHGWSFNDFQPSFLRKFYILLERLCARFSDRSKGLKNKIGLESQYEIVPYGVNHGDFQKNNATLREEFGILPSDTLVGMVSCFKPQKAPLDFIEVALLVTRRVRDVKFILIGDGILRSSIQQLISKYGLQDKVILAGWRRDIPQALTALDIFMLTSLWEGFPIAVLEAAASGKAVVATHTGGIAELIKDGRNGFLVAPKETEKMAERLINLINDAGLRFRMGEEARFSVASSFSLAAATTTHQSLYLKLYA
jgi:glycosyltransferase involved in cell wall biosynthesis